MFTTAYNKRRMLRSCQLALTPCELVENRYIEHDQGDEVDGLDTHRGPWHPDSAGRAHSVENYAECKAKDDGVARNRIRIVRRIRWMTKTKAVLLLHALLEDN